MNYKEKNPKINIKNLGEYGFSDEVIEGLIKYDILPPIETRTRKNGDKDYFMFKSDVLMLINKFMVNSLKVYELVNDAEEKIKSVKATIESAEEVK